MKGGKLTILCQVGQWLTFPGDLVTFNIFDDLGLQYEESTVNPANFIAWLFFEARNVVVVINVQDTKAARG